MTVINNYIVPGVSSHMLTETAVGGKIRMFKASRTQMQYVTPHSHRFNLTSIVLRGWVRNTIFHHKHDMQKADHKHCETFLETEMVYNKLGQYKSAGSSEQEYIAETNTYEKGQMYSMAYHMIHSIEFSKDAEVLIIESPDKANGNRILEPIVNGKVIEIMEVKDWMFEHEQETKKTPKKG